MLAYLFACAAAHHAAIAQVKDFAAANHIAIVRLGALPVPPSLLGWGGEIRTPDGVYQTQFDLRDSDPPVFRFFADSPPDQFTTRALQLPEVQLYWQFARFPVIRTSYDGSHHVVEFGEHRFVSRNSNNPLPFRYHVVFDGTGNLIEQGWYSDSLRLRRSQQSSGQNSGEEFAMKILIFSDIHGDIRALEKIAHQPADVYIAAGDLSNFGKGLDRCAAVLGPLGERLWVLPGNHETHEQTAAFCKQHGFVDFHRQVRSLGATHWAGLGYSNITPFDTPGEYSEEEITVRSRLLTICVRCIWPFISRRTARSSMSLPQENMREARRCVSGLSERSPDIFSADTSTKLRDAATASARRNASTSASRAIPSKFSHIKNAAG